MKRILWAMFALVLLLLAVPSLISGPEEAAPEPIRVEAVLQQVLLPQTETIAPTPIRRCAPVLTGQYFHMISQSKAAYLPVCDGNGVVLRGSYIFSAYPSFRLSERAG